MAMIWKYYIKFIQLASFLEDKDTSLLESVQQLCEKLLRCMAVSMGIVGFNVPLDTLHVISETILQVRCPNQQCEM